MIRGKLFRLNRIMNRDSGKTIVVPMDHGATMGPLRGLENLGDASADIVNGGADAVIVHKGMLKCLDLKKLKSGLIVHLSASSKLNPKPLVKASVCDVEEAICHGADGVSIHVNLGVENEGEMIRSMGETAKECSKWGIPLLAMMYTHGTEPGKRKENIKISARIGAELGADIIKCPYTGDEESFAEVVEGCPVPVLIAGGEKTDNESALKLIEGAMNSGAAGLSMGRNAFQHEKPELFIKAACSIVHNGLTAEQACEKLILEDLSDILQETA